MKKMFGLTLIELIISIMILSILTGVLYNFFFKGIELLDLTQKNSFTITNITGILNRIKNDYSYAENIYYFDTNSLYFYTYLNNDTDLSDIRYKFLEPNLYVFNSKYNDTGIIKNLNNVLFNISQVSNTDTILSVTVKKNNIQLTGKFISLND